MRLRAWNTDRLQCVSLIKRIGDAAAIRGRPIHRLVGDFGRHGSNCRHGCSRLALSDVGTYCSRRCRAGNCRHHASRCASHWTTRRHVLLDPAEQSRQIGRNAGRYWERGDVVSRDSIDNGQTGVDVGAVLGIDGAVNCRREYDTALFLQPLEGTGPCGIVGRDVCACDGNQPSAFGKSSQGGSDVTQCRLSHLSIDMDRSRERRVHQHDIRHDAGIEVVVNVSGVKLGRGGAGKQLRENADRKSVV